MNLKRKSRRRSLRILHYPALSMTAENDDVEELSSDSEMYGSKWLPDSKEHHTQNQQIQGSLDQQAAAAEVDPSCSMFLHCAMRASPASTSGQDVFITPELYQCSQQQEKRLYRTPVDLFECGMTNETTLNKVFFLSEQSPACVGDTLPPSETKENLSNHQVSPLLDLSTPKEVFDISVSRDQMQHPNNINTKHVLSRNIGLSVPPLSVDMTEMLIVSSKTASGQIPHSTSASTSSLSTVGFGSIMISASAYPSVDGSNYVSALGHSNEGFLSAPLDVVNSLDDRSSVAGVDVQKSTGSLESQILDMGNSDGHTVGNDNLSVHHYDGEIRHSEINTAVVNTDVPVSVVISHTTELHQHCGSDSEVDQKPNATHSINNLPTTSGCKQQDAKIKKQRRRSRFGAEFMLATCAHQDSPSGDSHVTPEVSPELEFSVQKKCVQDSLLVSPSYQPQCVTCTVNDGKVQPVILANNTNSNSDIISSTEDDLKLRNLMAVIKEVGLAVTGSCDQESARGEQLQDSQPNTNRKRKRRMSADSSVMAPNAFMSSTRDQSGGSVSEHSVFTRRRSSLRLVCRQSHKFSISSRTCDESANNKAQSESSESPVSTYHRNTELLAQLPNDACVEPADMVISPELESLYHNKNYKKPAEKTWETIFESPAKGKMTSKKKFRRYLPFEDDIPMSKLKRRWKKATQNGWDASDKIQNQMNDQAMKQKLKKLAEELSDA